MCKTLETRFDPQICIGAIRDSGSTGQCRDPIELTNRRIK